MGASDDTDDSTDSGTGGDGGSGRASYVVTGMTCEHCVASVTEEVGEIAGVRDVAVDLVTGSLSFASDRTIARETVADAVREAGYELQ